MRGCALTDPDVTSDGAHVQPLQALIRSRMDERGWSYADLAHRTGDELTRGRWQQLGSGVRLKAFPEPATIRLMARALEVEETAVVLAAAKSLGLDVRRNGPRLAQMLPSGTDLLSPSMQTAIVEVIRVAVTEALLHTGDVDERQGDVTARQRPFKMEWDETPQARRNAAAGGGDA